MVQSTVDLTRSLTVGIIGAGQMGQGIAEVFLLQNHQVLLFDSNLLSLERVQAQLLKRLEIAEGKGKITKSERERCAGNLQMCCTLAPFARCDLVIEAIVENMDAKMQLFAELCPILHDRCVLATNTSSLSIAALANVVKSPGFFLGIHFFNPAHHMPLVEIIPHKGTAENVVQWVQALLTFLGKTGVVCHDSPGFIVNRLLLPMINQAAHLLQTRTASADDIDKAMHLGANFPMGPLALADFIGLDVIVSILKTLYQELGNEIYNPADVLIDAVNHGQLGRKTGQGFFTYPL